MTRTTVRFLGLGAFPLFDSHGHLLELHRDSGGASRETASRAASPLWKAQTEVANFKDVKTQTAEWHRALRRYGVGEGNESVRPSSERPTAQCTRPCR